MKAAIIGCGSIANVHAAALKKEPEVTLSAFADCDSQRAIDFAKRYGAPEAKAYESYEEMISIEKPDVLHICTPHYLHVPMAIHSLNHGCQVFMEKPPGISRGEFSQLMSAEKEGKQIGICLQNRYNQTTKKVEELLAHGAFGDVLGARAFVTWCRDDTYYTESGWRGEYLTEGGGALINQAVHTLDLLVHFLGRPQWTESAMANHHLKRVIEVEDTIEAYIQFKGAGACFYATTAYASDSDVLLELTCRNGVIRMEGDGVTCRFRDGRKERFDFCNTAAPGKSYWGNGHGACIHDFYQALLRKEKVKHSASSAADTFGLMMDIYESARSGKQIFFSGF